jgi:hypothetical protein
MRYISITEIEKVRSGSTDEGNNSRCGLKINAEAIMAVIDIQI